MTAPGDDLLPSPGTIAALLAGGFAAGVINTLAGAGSMINLPLLAQAGMMHTVANASNRLAVLIQGLTAVVRFQRAGVIPWRELKLLVLPVLIGSAVGAVLATRLSDRLFRPIVGLELLVLAGLLVLRPQLWLAPSPPEESGSGRRGRAALFFLIGVYAGFLQAGVGFFLIAGLVRRAGLELVRANAAKVVLTLAATVVSLCVFIAAGMMAWAPALILSVGNGVGGWVGAHLSVRKGARWIHRTLVVTVLVSAAEILGLFSLLAGLLSRGAAG